MSIRRLRVVGPALLLSLALAGVLASPALAAPETPVTKPAFPVVATTATLTGELPNGTEERGEYEFLYAEAPKTCTEGTGAPVPAGPALGIREEAVATKLTGLKPETGYTFCLLERTESGMAIGNEETFTTGALSAPTVQEQYVTYVSSSSATLHAKVDPDGASTSYAFEYSTGGGEYTPFTAPGATGSIEEGLTGVPVQVNVQNLTPGTAYTYRIATSNAVGPFDGEGQTLTTQLAGTETALLDNRQWELVSPADKEDGAVLPLIKAGGDIQAATDGQSLAYLSAGPVVGEPEGNTEFEPAENIARRTSSGWVTQDLDPPHDAPTEVPVGEGFQYKLLSTDLSTALLDARGSTPLPPLTAGAEKKSDLYIRRNATDVFEPLVTSVDAPTAKEIDTSAAPLTFDAASANLEHVVFTTSEALIPGAPRQEGTPHQNLYEWTNGHISLVSVLPDGEALTGGLPEAAQGYPHERQVKRDAVADDGAVVWEAEPLNASSIREPHLYLSGGEQAGPTAQIDTPEATAESASTAPDPIYQGATQNADRVLFTDPQPLTTDARQGQTNLYVYERAVPGRSAQLKNLTADEREAGGQVESAEMLGDVVGYGEDADGAFSVYFVDSGVLGDGAVAGGDNLYVEQSVGGMWQAPRFIAALAPEDAPTWAGDKFNLSALTARVSPDGRFLAFMSSVPLTGYDNLDAVSGARDEEVFEYDSASSRVVCASCTPDGSSPIGVQEPEGAEEPALLVDEQQIWGPKLDADAWLAGNVPGWTSDVGEHETLYQSRYLDDSGRLFFTSPVGLVPADVNGKEDVYEYEPAGPTCSAAASSQSVVFKGKRLYQLQGSSGEEREEPAGCVGLLSSGLSGKESAFLDAGGVGPGGEEGEDVFFITTGQLVPEDTDTAFDVYDAHVCSTASPCLTPTSGIAATPCGEAASCRAPAAPQPSIYGTPASAGFVGAGNAAAQATSKPAAKPLTRAQKLANALKACKRDRSKKRALCEIAARRRYRASRQQVKVNRARDGKGVKR